MTQETLKEHHTRSVEERPKATKLEWVKFWFSTHKMLAALIALAVPYLGANVVQDVSKIIPRTPVVNHEQVKTVPKEAPQKVVQTKEHPHPYALKEHLHAEQKLPSYDNQAANRYCDAAVAAAVNFHLTDLHGL